MGREFEPREKKRLHGHTYTLYDKQARGKTVAKTLAKQLREKYPSVLVVEKLTGFYVYYREVNDANDNL